ncbi:type I restriction endonuclease subunit R [Hydrogenobacter hydrogenophilus]|uniref:Type I restriction enzyme endonuclease subunit n=1 Tax=Hydrogenobacter hydrogenophilus TaxID=35835 RepID=A0A285NR99_9AQUI|nr:type I restriction endonuclease subunit R [Hydrogenobacter hydrogenophilus]SNZ12042.1 type I restriction enzyme, R subunit [Hydrogenobacter hydrogenophilus]
MAYLTENYMVENSAINWFKEIGYNYIHGSELTPDNNERETYRDVILKKRFIQAVKKINPFLNENLAEEVYKKVKNIDHPDFIIKSKTFYEYLTEGLKLTYREGKEEKTRIVKLVDFENPENNEFLIANQFKVGCYYEDRAYRIPDLVVFINGLPIAVFEFKNFNSNQTAKDAYHDHRVKMKDIPQLYLYSLIIAVSDGYETKYGSPISDWERFFNWEGIFSDDDVKKEEIMEGSYRYFYNGKELTSLEILIKGLFRKEHITEFINDFVFYEKSGENYIKKIAAYHQFYAVKKAIERTKKCVLEGKTPEDRRVGVIWHTQGSGKSLTMLFYARKILKELGNPLLIFITDRKELDEQLYSLFSQMPISKQAESIKDLQETIKNTAGGIIFSTIQKFSEKNEEYPVLTERKDIIVIADEAHRSQYRELARNLRKAIPNASFLGFTATPIELEDRDTYLVFGEPVSIYSIDKALKDGVVVPIYYEARLVELHLTNEFIDEEFEEISEGLAPEMKENLKRKYARLEQLILNPERIEKIARDIVEHFNKRVQEFEGKAMVVVISRKVAVELYNAIRKIPDAPSIEIVISGSKQKDPEEFHPHIRNKHQMEELLNNFKNPDKDPKMVIVVDMLLTGFDVPCLHTMYIDKPMKNHNLLQAIARVNRVYKDKPGGLIVDYIGIADDLRKSLSKYTLETIEQALTDINKVINQMKEKYDIVSSFFYGTDYKNWKNLSPEELSLLTVSAYNRLESEDKKRNFIKNFIALKKLYALASPQPETIKIKDDLKFFEMVKKMIIKYSTRTSREIARNLEYEMNQLISKSISAQEPVDIFSLINKEKPDISIFSEDFLNQIKDMEYKNYAIELLAKLINDEIKVRVRKNKSRYQSLYDRLKDLLEKYNIKLIETTDVIVKLIEIAKELKEKIVEGKNLDLTEEELAFYDMLLNEGIFKNEQEVKEIAKEISQRLGYYVKIADWNKKESIKAKIRKTLKDVLMKKINNYDYLDKIVNEILEQAELIFA